MKKSFLILLSAVILLFTACDSWMQDDDFYADIENDVKVANAQQINVYVRYALTRQGKTDPDGPATFKVEIPHKISATTEPAYGFVRWAAFSTDFLATGDNQSKNKDVYYIDEEDYNTRLAPKEIKAPAVVFEDPKKPETKVRVNVNRNDIFIVPIVAQRPAVALSIPAVGASDVVRNMSVRISFTKPMDPQSFKNEAGEYDKITITQGRQSLSADGDIEIISQDITDRFEAPVFSRNMKMITLKFKESEKAEGFAAQSSVSVIISKDVKDSSGFTMSDDDRVTFSIGSAMDTLAPRIIRLTAGTTLSNFDTFQGMYRDKETWNNISGVTQMASWIQGSGSSAIYFGANEAPDSLDGQVENINFYDKFAPLQSSTEPGYRVGTKIYIHTIAEDIAGSGVINNPTALENDVAMIGVKATLMFDNQGNYVAEADQPLAPDGTLAGAPVAFNYLAQNVGPGITQTFINLVHARNVANNTTDPSDSGYIPEDKGFLFEYDLSKMPDGLIRLDVYATDTVQNSGYTENEQYSKIYGNGYSSLFVVKDTTPPDAATNAASVTFDVSHKTEAHYFNNVAANSHNRSQIQINADTSSIVDAGHERLRSKHDNIKWVAKLTSDTSWKNSVPATAWAPVNTALGGASAPSYFAEPAAQGTIPFTYALMDDLGNISEVAAIAPATTVYYDSVAPGVGNFSFSAVAGSGETAGMASSNVLTNQILSIPVTEETSGLKSITFKITKGTNTSEYGSAVMDSSLAVTINGTPYTLNGTGATGYDKSGKTITFNSPINLPAGSVITVKGLKIWDSIEEAEYTINAAVTDASDNITTTSSQRALINIDHTAPSNAEIKIPAVKAARRYGNSDTPEYWIDYSSLSNTSGTPRTYVDIKFTENNTGAKVFDFASSSMKLTDESNIFVINSGFNAVSDALTVTRDLTNNKITIDSSQAVKTNGTTIAGVRITNVELAAEGYDSNISLHISDVATNLSDRNPATPNENEAYIQLSSSDNGTTLTFNNFKFDSGTPVTGTPSYEDRGIEDANHIEAMPGYTSEQYIKATVVFTPTTSGIYELQLDGDATFESGVTTITNNATTPATYPYAPVGTDGKTIRFTKAVSGNDVPAVLGSGTSNITIIINNLKLTSGDDTKSVAIKAKSFGGVQNTGTSSEIYLDETDPVWVGPGLYTQSFYVDEPEELTYPHPVSNGKAYGIAGSTISGGNRDLYFYSSVGSDDHLSKFYRIAADFTEDHHRINSSNEDVTVRFEADNGTLIRENLVLRSRTEFGNMKARVRDMAGNQSDYKTFAVVKDEEFAVTNPNPNASNPADAEYKAIDNYMTLQMPDSAASVFASQGAGDLSYAANTFSYYPSTPGYNLRAHGYVIKQGSNPYKIIVKLGSQGTASTDKQVDGVTAVPVAGNGTNNKYNRTKITTSSAPLEYYSVSHWYDYYRAPEFDSNSFIPITPDYDAAANSLYWHPYSESSTDGVTHPDVDIVSRVDEYGNIEIEIPRTTGCPPVTLILKDACGNITYRLIRPISFNTADANSNRTNNAAVAWIVDNEVGQGTYRGLTSFTLDTAVVKGYSDANFYNGTVTLNSGNAWSEACRYTTSDVLGGDAGSESAYSLKSRIITWTDTANPTQTAFENATTGPNASAWYYRKQSNSLTGDTSFGLVNDFPQNAASSTYKLFYIVQDTVGNYDIYQITRTSASDITLTKVFTSTAELNNVTVSGVKDWLYDATGPVITTPIPDSAFHKINTVGGVNYYSENSVIDFTITDGGSGVWKSVNAVPAYPGFGQRSSVPVEYQLTSAATTPASTSTTPGALKIATADVYDYAGNNMASAFEFTKGSSSQWIRLDDAPTLPANAAVAVNTSSGQTANEGLTGNTDTSTDSTTSGQKLELTAKWGVSNITIKLYTNYSSSQNETGETRILGWVVSPSKITNFSDFYSSSDVSSDVTWDSTNTCWKYVYSKTSSDPWHTAHSGKKYFYPVSKSGIICQTPVMVQFLTNNPPTIVNGTTTGFAYSSNAAIDSTYLASDAPVPSTSIKVATSGTTAINYTRSSAAVTFTTTENPTLYRFITTGAGSDGSFGTSDDVTQTSAALTLPTPTSQTDTTKTYSVTLPTNLSGHKLKIQLSRGLQEDSDVYEIKGPIPIAGDNANNLWTYDNIGPELSIGSTPTIKSGSSSGSDAATFDGDTTSTKYIQSANAYIAWTLTHADDVAHYQWKRKAYNATDWTGSVWEDFSSSYVGSSGITFPAPESKTDYMFRVIDTAGNISATTSAVRLQHDEWGPSGNLTYTTNRPGTETNPTGSVDLLTPLLNTDYTYDDNGTTRTDSDTRVISYSSSTDSPYYINSIQIDLSAISDDVSGIARSGKQGYKITMKAGSGQETIYDEPAATATSATIDISSNTTGIVYIYKVIAIDNIGNEKILKTFRTQDDNVAPALTKPTNFIQAANADGTNVNTTQVVRYPSSDGTYYLKNDKVIITFTIDDDNANYYWSNDNSTWKNSGDTDLNGKVVTITKSFPNLTYTFDAGDTARPYYFKAVDRVGNSRTVGAASGADMIKLQRDKWAPAGDVGYTVNAGSDNVNLTDNLVTTTAASGDTPANVDIKYSTRNTSSYYIKNLVLNLSAVNDIEDGIVRSGISGYDIYVKTGLTAGNGNVTQTAAGNAGSTTIDLTGNTAGTTYTYTVMVNDHAGNSKILKTFTLTGYATEPDFAVGSIQSSVQLPATTGTYYLSSETAVINFTKTNAVISEIVNYEVKVGTGNYSSLTDAGITKTETTDTVTYSFAAPTTATTYSFKFTNIYGNSQEISSAVTLVQDITPPALASGVSTLSFAVLNASDAAATEVSNTNPVANYIRSANGSTVTLTYNPGVVKKLSFNALSTQLAEYATSGANSGFDKLYYKLSTETTPTAMTGTGYNEIVLGNDWNGTYYIYAKDKAGNQTAADAPLMTLVLVADSTGPVPGTVDSENNISGYSAQDSSGVATSIHIAWDEVTYDHGKSNVYSAGTKVLIPVSDANASVVATYSMVTTTGNTYLSNPTLANLTWSDMEISEGNYIIPLPSTGMTALHNRIALFFKDTLGNISGPYYLGNPTTAAYNWWIREEPFDASNITISKTASGTEYTVTITPPVGAIIKSISLGGELTWATGGNTPPQGDYTHPVRFGGYVKGAKNGKVEAVAGTAWKGEDVSTASGGEFIGWINNSTITLKTWAPGEAAQDTLNIIINGDCSKNIFASMAGGTGTDGIDIISVLGTEISGEDGTDSYGTSPKSRVAQFFSSVADVFARNREAAPVEQTSVEKPAVSAKKTKKAAKKAAKKSSGTGMAVEAAEIVEQTLTSTVPEVSVATESVVSEIAAVTEKVESDAAVLSTGSSTAGAGATTVTAEASSATASAVADTSTAVAAEADAGSRSPSKSASIVIMLAILSSFGGAWYYKKTRKK